jgi:hypothetical protein
VDQALWYLAMQNYVLEGKFSAANSQDTGGRGVVHCFGFERRFFSFEILIFLSVLPQPAV